MGWPRQRRVAAACRSQKVPGVVTADQNLQFQQNLSRSRIAVVVLIAASIAIEDLRPLLPKLAAAIRRSRPGKLLRVS
jgi:hypothetical protein